MKRGIALAAAAIALLAGCETFVSDVATRIRYALRDAQAELKATGSPTHTFTLAPNHWPDGCGKAARYRVVLSPYKGGKQVAVGDIKVFCENGRHYYTGFGSEEIVVARELAVEKRADEGVRITLRRATTGLEIVALE